MKGRRAGVELGCASGDRNTAGSCGPATGKPFEHPLDRLAHPAVLCCLLVGLRQRSASRGVWREGGWRGAARHPPASHLTRRLRGYRDRVGYAAATYWLARLLRGASVDHLQACRRDRSHPHDVIVALGTWNVVRRNYAVARRALFGAVPRVLVEHRGEGAEAMIGQIEAAVASYPHADEYRSYPGPNSNTFLAHIGREVPALRPTCRRTRSARTIAPSTRPLGVSPSGSGLQFSLLGLLGVSVGAGRHRAQRPRLHFGLTSTDPPCACPASVVSASTAPWSPIAAPLGRTEADGAAVGPRTRMCRQRSFGEHASLAPAFMLPRRCPSALCRQVDAHQQAEAHELQRGAEALTEDRGRPSGRRPPVAQRDHRDEGGRHAAQRPVVGGVAEQLRSGAPWPTAPARRCSTG